MAVVFKNNASTTLNGAITNSATSITVTNGAVFPTVTARSAITAPVDNGHYNDTGLLWNTDGTNGSTTVTDTITSSNATVGSGNSLSTTNPKFGTACLSMTNTATNVYQTTAQINITSRATDFLIEGFLAPDFTGSNRTLFGFSNASGGDAVFIKSYGYGASSATAVFVQNNSSGFAQSTWEYPNWSASGSYTHVALERYNSLYTCWINGTRLTNVNNLDLTATYDPDSLQYFFIGGGWIGSHPTGFTGKADELRYSKIARYKNAATITVPSTAFGFDGYNDPTQYSNTNSTTAGDYFYATITDGTNREVVNVTAVSGNTLTVTRGQDGTSGTAFASGSTIEIRPTNQGLIDLGDDRFYRDVATRSKRYLGA